MTASAAEGLIVVGVDGSDSSKDALRWAAEQARQTSAKLRVVGTWVWPAMLGYSALPPDFDLETGMRRVVDETVDAAFSGEPDVPVERRVVEGSPAAVLLAESGDADLLVVGSRGHGAFSGMLLGSVSAHCVSHASCPVVVVRHPRNASSAVS